MENVIHIKFDLDCDVHNAFEQFAQSELLENWLTEKAEVEPKIGGKYELFWNLKNREIDSTIGCKITAIEQDTFISFDWKGPVEFQNFMNFADPLTHVIVFFSQSKRNQTTIHFFQTGWRKDKEWQKAREYFEEAWLKAFQTLKANINKQN